MTEHSLDIDAVTQLIEDVARDVVLPKFRSLRDDEITRKPSASHSHIDIVTVVDRQSEARLSDGLRVLRPAARVVGEEAVHARPDLLSLVSADDPLWIVDPLDGTHNFADGHDAFGIMVSFVIDGTARAAWVHLPARHEMFVAEAGSGAFLNGARIAVPDLAPPDVPSGTIFVRYMPDDLRTRVTRQADARFMRALQTGAAAVEYTDILRGMKDFDVYFRLLPWDHGAPALILSEAGGRVEHLDGTSYTVRSPNQVTIVARSPEVAARVRDWFANV